MYSENDIRRGQEIKRQQEEENGPLDDDREDITGGFNRCPSCGSREIVLITPARPGPDGWGGRCKSCGVRWNIVGDDAEECAAIQATEKEAEEQHYIEHGPGRR